MSFERAAVWSHAEIDLRGWNDDLVDSVLALDPVSLIRFPVRAQHCYLRHPRRSHIQMLNKGGSPNRVTFSMGHAGASRKSPKGAPWEALNRRLSRPVSAPLLTLGWVWRKKAIKRQWQGGFLLASAQVASLFILPGNIIPVNSKSEFLWIAYPLPCGTVWLDNSQLKFLLVLRHLAMTQTTPTVQLSSLILRLNQLEIGILSWNKWPTDQ